MQHLYTTSWRARIFYLFFFSFIGLFLASGIVEVSVRVFNISQSDVWYFRFSSFMQSLLMFFFPALTVAIWSSPNPLQFLGIQNRSNLLELSIIGMLLFIVCVPFTSLLSQLNLAVILPEWLNSIEQSMKNAENYAKEVTELMLSGKNVVNLTANILLIGVFAAISEELFFRGVIQKSLHGMIKNVHLVVFISAFIFSATHMQFYGFLPRLLLGLLLGYLYLYSGNLWVPIIAHFFNNCSVLILDYFFADNSFINKVQEPEINTRLYIIAFTSLLAIIGTLYFFKIKAEKVKPEKPDELKGG